MLLEFHDVMSPKFYKSPESSYVTKILLLIIHYHIRKTYVIIDEKEQIWLPNQSICYCHLILHKY